MTGNEEKEKIVKGKGREEVKDKGERKREREASGEGNEKGGIRDMKEGEKKRNNQKCRMEEGREKKKV